MNSGIILITGSEKTKEALVKQLREYIPADIAITGMATESGIKRPVNGQFVAFSSDEVHIELLEMGMFGDIKKHIICNRTIDLGNIEEIVAIPEKTKVLFVNDTETTTSACISDLRDMGISHITLLPYYPGIEHPEKCEGVEIAITAGEEDKAPKHVKRIIDMGVRIIDIISLYKIIGALGIDDFDVNRNLKKYLKKIVSVSQKVAVNTAEVENLRRNLKNELIIRGYQAQYAFGDIIGDSPSLKRAKDRAEKLAATDLTILIEGESGTGKELFASAIHNASSRKDKAFLAVNFSALPEELVESELFGYEEGAFTGAKKGGKRGIFELAEGGTLFLDEIGDVSPRVQTKLLRVLQEKEIMPIGGSVIKKVDIRIIAATNQNLLEMVKDKKFRPDLYYRLKIGHVQVPTLRERKSDIRKLALHFLEKEGGRGHLDIDQNALKLLESKEWLGNVRELLGVIKYMVAVRDKDILTVDDFPEEQHIEEKPGEYIGEYINHEQEAVLESIGNLNRKHEPAGRVRISSELGRCGKALTISQVRRNMSELEAMGFVDQGKGRQGCKLTEKGVNWLNSNQ